MNMLNSVLIEGVMTAGLTLDGRFTIETTRLEGGEAQKLVILCKLSPAILSKGSIEDIRKIFKSGTIFRCVGRIEGISGDIGVLVEHFEKCGARFGKYTFTNKD